MTRQTSVQITRATENQVAELTEKGFGTFTDICRIAIDRMARDEGCEMLTPFDELLLWASSDAGVEFPENAEADMIETRLERKLDRIDKSGDEWDEGDIWDESKGEPISLKQSKKIIISDYKEWIKQQG